MKRRRNGKQTAAALVSLIAVVLSCLFGTSVLQPRAADTATVSSLENRYSELEKKLNALNKEMSKTQNQKSQQIKYKKQLDEQISVVEEQIANLSSQVTVLNAQIRENQKMLTQKEGEISENDTLFKARLRAMYMSGDTTIWQVLFGSKNFSDFLQNAEYMKRLAQSDQQLMDKLHQDRQSIVQAREAIETSKIKLQANQKTMESKKKTLDNKFSESQRLLSTLTKEENSLRAQQIKLNEEMEEIDEQIREMLRNQGSSGAYVGGQFAWPLPGYSTITSKFGWRTLYGRKNWHTGIDISGASVYGKNIVAANAGTVTKVVTSYIPGKGYGKYVMIDHGGGYVTLYAHCSAISARVGKSVKRGDVIAQVGSTGNSTGPHLHFGIYINGKETDPLPYLR